MQEIPSSSRSSSFFTSGWAIAEFDESSRSRRNAQSSTLSLFLSFCESTGLSFWRGLGCELRRRCCETPRAKDGRLEMAMIWCGRNYMKYLQCKGTHPNECATSIKKIEFLKYPWNFSKITWEIKILPRSNRLVNPVWNDCFAQSIDPFSSINSEKRTRTGINQN